MTMDLWNFNKESLQQSLQKSNEELPDSILREQAEALGKKTDGIVYGKTSNMKYELKSGKEKYTMATMFDYVFQTGKILSSGNYSGKKHYRGKR